MRLLEELVIETTTVLSAVHKYLISLLESWGFELLEEVDFPPYRVDIYIPDAHIAIEVDGPQHSKKQDKKRDEELLTVYYLPTFRVKARDVKNPDKWKHDLLLFLAIQEKTVDDRWERCKLKTPWL